MASYYIVSYSYSGSGQTGYTNIVEEALKAKSLERSGEPDWTARIGDKSSGKVEEHKKADGGLDESVTEGWVTKGCKFTALVSLPLCGFPAGRLWG